MGWFRDLMTEWKARRAGRRFVDNGIRRSARDVTGVTGWMWSGAWKHLDEDGAAYLKSFDPKVPPSLHISERDRQRHSQVIPVAERCLEDWHRDEPGGLASTEPAATADEEGREQTPEPEPT